MIKDEFGNRRFYGFYRGVIQSVNDPEGLGRVKIQVPQVLFSETTGWIWGSEFDRNQDVLPKVGQGVYLAFEGGDPSYPIFLGFFGEVVNDTIIDCGLI